MASAGEATPIIRLIQNFLSRRPVKNALRMPEKMSNRSQPPPNLPPGISHKLSNNYYCTRDARRVESPPQVVYVGGNKALPSGAEGKSNLPSKTMAQPKVPGGGYDYGFTEGVFKN